MPLLAQAPVSRPTPRSVTPVAVTLRTTMGDIELELYPDRAPVTVGNFLAYVDAGHFDDGSFYRVVRVDNDNGDPKIE
ncbi:MAG TPA: peptidylprolyl isomerase, partial [Gemmatimonadetes bacterium]|nr:peptidylprolyl isomerase [Gemmatimonadota bacterium]